MLVVKEDLVTEGTDPVPSRLPVRPNVADAVSTLTLLSMNVDGFGTSHADDNNMSGMANWFDKTHQQLRERRCGVAPASAPLSTAHRSMRRNGGTPTSRLTLSTIRGNTRIGPWECGGG